MVEVVIFSDFMLSPLSKNDRGLFVSLTPALSKGEGVSATILKSPPLKRIIT